MRAGTSSLSVREYSGNGLRALTAREFFFFVALAVWLVASVLFQTSLEPLLSNEIKAAKLVALVICVLCELTSGVRYGKTDVLLVFFIVVAALSSFILSTTLLLQAFIIIFCSRLYELDKVLTCFAWTVAVSIAVVSMMSDGGLIESLDLSKSSSRVARSSMGFVWPSRFPTFFFAVVIAYVCVKKERSSLFFLAGAFLLNYFIYLNTDSRNPFLITALLIIAIAGKRLFSSSKMRRMRKGKWIWLFACALLLISIIAPLMYDASQRIWVSVDNILAHRLMYSSALLENAHITLFGSRDIAHQDAFDSVLDGYFDSGYLLLFFGFGAIAGIFLLGGLTCVLIRAYAFRDSYVVLGSALTLCFSLFYAHMMLYLCFSPMMFYIPYALSRANAYGSEWVMCNCKLEKKRKYRAIGQYA